jgi:hypothetical protein
MLMAIYQKAQAGHPCHDVADVPEHAVPPPVAPVVAEPITPWETPA